MVWLQLRNGKVLYLNMELDRPSGLQAFQGYLSSYGDPSKTFGKYQHLEHAGALSIPMDKLTPKLIRRAQKEKFDAVIIDPIYKVLTGSENDAEQMAKFTNNFDKVAMELGTSVIYCSPSPACARW